MRYERKLSSQVKSVVKVTKLKSQALYNIRIKYRNAGGSGNPPSLIPALWNIGILLIKRPPGPNNMTASV